MTENTLSGAGTRHARRPASARPAQAGMLLRALGALTAVMLAIDAYVHFHDAHIYRSVGTSPLTEADLFRAQAVVAVVVAIALLVYPRLVVWAIAVLVTASATGAVLLYTYVDVGKLGPLPNLNEATWAVPGKTASAVAEGIGTVLAIIGLIVAIRTRTGAGSASGPDRDQPTR